MTVNRSKFCVTFSLTREGTMRGRRGWSGRAMRRSLGNPHRDLVRPLGRQRTAVGISPPCQYHPFIHTSIFISVRLLVYLSFTLYSTYPGSWRVLLVVMRSLTGKGTNFFVTLDSPSERGFNKGILSVATKNQPQHSIIRSTPRGMTCMVEARLCLS